jgi:Tfp pilus assembly protein PilF
MPDAIRRSAHYSLLLGLLLSPARLPARQKNSSPAQTPSQPPSQQDKPTYDPFHAEQDVEIGTFYMHKGDVDAAILRFQDAIRLRPDFAKPRLLLAQAYEKKHDKPSAVKYYKEYLRVYPTAPDANKVRKKIEELSE